jgi:hypothetical protein
MKKLVLASVLLLLLAAVSIAEGSNYQIYSENRGFLGMGGRKVIMLDKTTGDSWIYVDDKWKPIVKEATAEAVSSADVVNAKLAAEMTALKEKQAEDIKVLKDKQEQELASLNAKLEASKPAARTVAAPAAHQTKPVVAKKKSETRSSAKPEDDSDTNGVNEAPPAWLNE